MDGDRNHHGELCEVDHGRSRRFSIVRILAMKIMFIPIATKR